MVKISKQSFPVEELGDVNDQNHQGLAMEFHHSLSNWKARNFLNYPRKWGHFLRLKKDRCFEVLFWIHFWRILD